MADNVRYNLREFHHEERLQLRMLNAIETGSLEAVRRRIPIVTRYDGGTSAISRIAYLAQNGKHELVRITALQTLQLLGDTARKAPILRPLLNDMRLNDTNIEIRAAAAKWLESGGVP